ncbi:MAG TPA: hypothetical protein VNP73_08855 [Actinomycetota bacterium]|nr:hypothetical protein [Actinomycetota bacterium]
MAISAREGRSAAAFFEELYAIVVGLGLAFAVEQVIDLDRPVLPVRADYLPIFLAYLTLAFALAHSSVRYLQLAYDQRGIVLDKVRVVADLFLGVGQFLLLIALSLLITRPGVFAFGAIVLLIGRPLRDLVLTLSGHDRLDLDRKVARLHIAVVLILGIALGAGQLVPARMEDLVLKVATLAASLGFGLGLYIGAFDFFFPRENEAS